MTADVRRAIEIVSASRQSHESWLIWYDRHPAEEANHAATCGDRDWHRQCIAGYDHVLLVLSEANAMTAAQYRNGLQGQIADLQAENASLREQVERLTTAANFVLRMMPYGQVPSSYSACRMKLTAALATTDARLACQQANLRAVLAADDGRQAEDGVRDAESVE